METPTIELRKSKDKEPYVFREAITQEEREACFRLRHRVFIEELGMQLGDHQSGAMLDEWDEDAVVLAAYKGSEVVATCRFNTAALERHPDFHDFGMKKFKGRSALGSKIVTHPEFRDGILFLRFVRFLFSWLVENGFDRNVLGCQVHLLPLYQRLGYRSCGLPVERKGVGHVYPLVLEHFDLPHLKKVGSPFIQVLKSTFEKGIAS